MMITKFLIKQGSDYYTIKPEFYSNNKYLPLTLSGLTIPDIGDFTEFGFSNLEELISEEESFLLEMEDKGVEGEGHIHRINISGYDTVSKIEEA